MLVAKQFFCPLCFGEGKDKAPVSKCCGVKPQDGNTNICPECEEECEFIVCPVCRGEGIVEADVEVESA